jgi:hypothetical protein
VGAQVELTFLASNRMKLVGHYDVRVIRRSLIHLLLSKALLQPLTIHTVRWHKPPLILMMTSCSCLQVLKMQSLLSPSIYIHLIRQKTSDRCLYETQIYIHSYTKYISLDLSNYTLINKTQLDIYPQGRIGRYI